MAYIPALIIALPALAVLVAQFHYLFRLRKRGKDTTAIVLPATFCGLLICERYLDKGGDVLSALATAFILSVAAFAVWLEAYRHVRDARPALLAEALPPRLS